MRFEGGVPVLLIKTMREKKEKIFQKQFLVKILKNLR